MPLSLYNTLSKRKEAFTPLYFPQVKMYTCGVTAYDECHIGHGRSLYIFDVMKRYLQYRNYEVTLVRNITDIDDKIINKAKELKASAKEVAEKYIASYYEDLQALGIEKAAFEPKATEHIPDMVKHIQGLIEKEYAYVVDGDVYFRVKKFSAYGKLSGQSIESMREAVRIESDPKKEDPLDFALWKKSKPGEPEYDSPWSKGRPGWHIECSVMSAKYLGETFDIHAGGMDLVFPHHENEIAQSEALSGKPFAKYWLHHGLLTINGQKMAKSLGNFITIKDALKKYSPDDLKLFFLSAHYSSPIDFTDDKMKEVHKRIQNIQNLLSKATRIVRDPHLQGVNVAMKEIDFITSHKTGFLEAMDDDFNTSRALGSIDGLIHDTHKFIDSEKNHSDYASVINGASETIIEWCKTVFGLEGITYWEPLTEEENNLLNERRQTRENKDFRRSDQIRDQLSKRGIIVEDTKGGQMWRRA